MSESKYVRVTQWNVKPGKMEQAISLVPGIAARIRQLPGFLQFDA